MDIITIFYIFQVMCYPPYLPFHHVIKDLPEVLATETLVLHLLLILHLTLTDLPVVKLVPPWWSVPMSGDRKYVNRVTRKCFMEFNLHN